MDHEFEPGDDRQLLDDDPLCRICGKPRREHDVLRSDNAEPEEDAD